MDWISERGEANAYRKIGAVMSAGRERREFRITGRLNVLSCSRRIGGRC